MNDNVIYSRQQTLNVKVPNNATVVGCGGVGYYVAINLALLGTKRISLIDPDVFEESNMNRLPITEDDLGRYKVEVIRDKLLSIRPNLDVFILPDSITNEFNLHLLKNTFVFICTDSLESQQVVFQYCKKNNIKFFKIGYDGRHFTITNSDVQVWELDPSSRYQIVPSYAITPQLAVLICLSFIDLEVDREIYVSMSIEDLIKCILR